MPLYEKPVSQTLFASNLKPTMQWTLKTKERLIMKPDMEILKQIKDGVIKNN